MVEHTTMTDTTTTLTPLDDTDTSASPDATATPASPGTDEPPADSQHAAEQEDTAEPYGANALFGAGDQPQGRDSQPHELDRLADGVDRELDDVADKLAARVHRELFADSV